MDCSDRIVMQRLLDNDLDEAQAELVSHHLESCAHCRAEVKTTAEMRTFVQDHLGIEDEGEADAAAAAIDRVARQLPIHRGASRWWGRTWLAAAAIVIIAVLLPLAFVPRVDAVPSKILSEAVARDRMWKYQPNKVLHWEVETDSQGVKNIADGRWRTLFWQKNGETSFAQISRQFDPQGRLERAYWQRPDGSTISYRARDGRVVEIGPSTAVSRQALTTLTPDLREALESYLAYRETTRTLGFHSRRDAEWLHRPTLRSGGRATLRRSLLDRWGEVYHINVVNEGPNLNATILRALHEYTIERSSFRLLRLKSTVTYADGTIGIHDSRWTVFQETSAAEFDAETPRDLLERGVPVVRLTPGEVAQRRLKEMNVQ
jgi:hypothetical protein